jgi:hypothetical protein
MAVLIRAEGEDQPPGAHTWYLETGFGPCRGEGALFPTLAAVETWIRDQIPAGWLAARRRLPPARNAPSA